MKRADVNRSKLMAAVLPFAIWIVMDGCSPQQQQDTCTPGASIACVGPGGCSGGQVCAANGSAFGECVCGSAPDASVDAAVDQRVADVAADTPTSVDAGPADVGVDADPCPWPDWQIDGGGCAGTCTYSTASDCVSNIPEPKDITCTYPGYLLPNWNVPGGQLPAGSCCGIACNYVRQSTNGNQVWFCCTK